VLEREPERPRTLNPRIDRDLETICLKCLEKEPGKRYGSAEELAEEPEHRLSGEPIRARPSSALERVRKWVRRKQATAGPWIVGIFASLAAMAPLAGASALVSPLLLAGCWLGVALYLLHQQSLLRDAVYSVGTVLYWAIFGGAVAVFSTFSCWETSGYSLPETILAALLVGAMTGALCGAISRSSSLPLATLGLIPLLGWMNSKDVFSAEIRSHGWSWFGTVLCLTLVTLAVAMWSRFTRLQRRLHRRVVYALWAFFLGFLGPVVSGVSLAVLCGGVGNALAGRAGLVGGEGLGAFLGGTLGAAIFFLAFKQVWKRTELESLWATASGETRTQEEWAKEYAERMGAPLSQLKCWTWPLLQLGMISASILWLILTNE
jgi:hypothetical protein